VNCPNGRVCNPVNGECVLDNLCEDVTCLSGEACEPGTGTCVPDPCIGVTCPEGSGQTCQVDFGGTAICAEPPGDRVFAGGGRGCAVGTGETPSPRGLGLVALVLIGLVRMRRRRRG